MGVAIENGKKRREQFFAEEAARSLGVTWQFESREGPDFIVTAEGHRFALEVTQVHVGAASRRGSHSRFVESANANWLRSINEEFQQTSSSKLDVKFLGEATDIARASLLTALRRERFDEKPVLHKMEAEVCGGKVWATKGPRARWTFLKDRVGWVSRDGDFWNTAIAKKATKLPDYRRVQEDVRLLVIADRTANSGKLLIDDAFQPDICGFDAVYLFSYPSEIKVFPRGVKLAN